MIREGLVEPISQQRHTLFGNNELNIESKSTFSLLVEEVRIEYLLPCDIAYIPSRLSILSMSFKLPASSCGH
jgi:hypothetical protein